MERTRLDSAALEQQAPRRESGENERMTRATAYGLS